MATIQASIQLYDGMSNTLRNINASVNMVIDVFKDMRRETEQAFNVGRLEEARQSLGQMESRARQIDIRIQEVSRAQGDFNDRLREGQDEANGLLGHVKKFVESYLGVEEIRMGVQFVTEALSLQNIQNEAETKLQGIMQQRMGASPDMVQQIKDLASAQQQLGVIGDELQLMGAQQLATFLNSGSALETLIPAMNNLAVQQNGVAVSTEAMTNVGNIMGKVMQGQVGELTRVGVSFNEAQERILKYGNEQERAAALAQVITDNVGNMNEIMLNTPQGQIQHIANAWRNIKETVGAQLYPAVLKLLKVFSSNMPRAETAVMGIAGALSVVINVLSWVVDGAGAVAGAILDNWSWIEPIMWGIVGVLGMYLLYLGYVKAAEVVGLIAKGALAVANGIHALAIWATTSATWAQTTAQLGLNGAMYACPIVWIIGLMIILIATFYAVVAWINKTQDTSISATGIIGAVFGLMAANIYNAYVYIWNIVAAFINFFYNVWNNPINAVKILFYDLASNVIECVLNMARAIENVINKIPNVEVSITAGLEKFQDKIQNAAEKAKSESEWKEIVGTKEFKDYENAAKKGYEGGSKIEDKIKGVLDDLKGIGDFGGAGGLQSTWEGIGNNTENTAANTAAMADSMDIMDENLKYMRDAAEQEIINRFTLAELKVDVNNNNNLTKQTDFDDMGRFLSTFTGEFLAGAAEGGHI